MELSGGYFTEREVSAKLTGGCLCGEVRYEINGNVLAAVHCHCLDCQKATGSGFATVIGIAREDFRLCTGENMLTGFTVTADSGRRVTREFCRRCGSPLFTPPEMNENMVWIKTGSLDDSTALKPTAACWTTRARSWAPVPVGVECYDRNPPG